MNSVSKNFSSLLNYIVTLICFSLIDECIEDGSWVVFYNCDDDPEFWSFMSFKLYQLQLGAAVHQQFRIFFVIRSSHTSNIPR